MHKPSLTRRLLRPRLDDQFWWAITYVMASKALVLTVPARRCRTRL